MSQTTISLSEATRDALALRKVKEGYRSYEDLLCEELDLELATESESHSILVEGIRCEYI